MQPYEVICAPYVAYIAPTGSTFPTVDNTTPASPWTTLGTAGSKSYMDTGVTVSHTQTVSTFVPGGSTAIRKAWRTAEELTVTFELADLSVAQYALIMNQASVVTQAPTTGQGGDSHFEAFRGVQVTAFALMVKGISPFNEAYQAQYEIPAAYNAGTPAPRFSKQGPATLAVEWHAYELNIGNLGTFRAQSAPHS